MSVPLWVSELAETFWRLAGGDDCVFPRALRRPIACALPITVVSLPRLRVMSVDDWLERQAILCGLAVRDRPLRACLVAGRGHGIIFLDGMDPEDEQRFSLAHELAHFLRDLWLPRDRAVGRFGPGILGVLDGERPPTAAERLSSLVSHVPVGLHVHLMERGAAVDPSVWESEANADRLAFELLAPEERVSPVLDRLPLPERHSAAVHLLVSTYGLPPEAARRYSRLLAAAEPASFVRRMRSTK